MRALMLRRALALAGLVVTWCVCEGARAPAAAGLEVLPAYRAWYVEIADCARRWSDTALAPPPAFDRVQWRSMHDSGRVVGHAALPDTVFLTRAVVGQEWAVKHELLHLALRDPLDGPMFALCGVRDPDTWREWQRSRPKPLPAILRGGGA